MTIDPNKWYDVQTAGCNRTQMRGNIVLVWLKNFPEEITIYDE